MMVLDSPVIMAGKELTLQSKEAAERLARVFEDKGWKPAEVASKLGYERTIVNKYVKATQKVSDQFLRKLEEHYKVSRKYIKLGLGEAFIGPLATRIKQPNFPSGTLGYPSNGNGHDDQVDHTNARSLGIHDPDVYKEVKFVSYRAWATFTDNFGDFDFQDVKETYPVYMPRLNFPITDRHMVFELMGDSMEERLYSRDVVLTELVDEGNFEYLNSWIYVVAYRNQLVVKRVIDNDLLLNGTLTLHSDNKKHGKITIRREDIRYIWRFNAVIFSSAV